MANYNLTQTGDEVQAYIDSIPVIDVTGTLNGSAITFGSNPYSQIAANYAADCSSIVRLTVGTAVYLLRVAQYDGTNYTAAEMSGAHNVVATIGSSSASATIDAGIDATPTQDSDNLVKSGGVYEEVSQLHQKVIYDVSANNDRATFASLSALLTSKNLSTLIPIAVRCGGMSIRFVQSSDNKYVQYRFLLSGSFTNAQFAIPTNWENVNETINVGQVTGATMLFANGSYGNTGNPNVVISAVIPTNGSDYIAIYTNRPNNPGYHYRFGFLCTSNKDNIGKIVLSTDQDADVTWRQDDEERGAKSLILDLTPYPTTVGVSLLVKEVSDTDNTPNPLRVSDFYGYGVQVVGSNPALYDFANVELKRMQLTNYWLGQDNKDTQVNIRGLVPGRKYKLYLENSGYARDNVTVTSTYIFYISSYHNSVQTVLDGTWIGQAVPDNYSFIVPADSDYISVGGRANIGEKVRFSIEQDIDKTIEGVEIMEPYVKDRIDSEVVNGSQGNPSNTWVVTVKGNGRIAIPVQAGHKYMVHIDRAPEEGFNYFYRLMTYSTENPTGLNDDKVRDYSVDKGTSIDVPIEIASGEYGMSIQLTELDNPTSLQNAEHCVALRKNTIEQYVHVEDITISLPERMDTVEKDVMPYFQELKEFSIANGSQGNPSNTWVVTLKGKSSVAIPVEAGQRYKIKTLQAPNTGFNYYYRLVTYSTENPSKLNADKVRDYSMSTPVSIDIPIEIEAGEYGMSIQLTELDSPSGTQRAEHCVALRANLVSLYVQLQDLTKSLPINMAKTMDKVAQIESNIVDNIVNRNADKIPMLINSCRFRKVNNTSRDYQVSICADMHISHKANENAIEATNKIDVIDAYVNSGDIVGSNYSEAGARSKFIADFNKLTKPGYIVCGNHDVGNCYYVGYACNHEQAYEAYIKPMVDKGFLANGEYEVGKPYWYHDDSTYKIRLIGLYEYDSDLSFNETYWEAVTYNSSAPTVAFNTAYNVGDVVNAHGYNVFSFKCVQAVTTPVNYYTTPEKLPSYKIQRGVRVIRQTQAQWFLDTLLSTPANYGVIVITHNPFSDTAVSLDKKFSWPSGINGSQFTQTNMSTNFIKDAIAAFIAGSNYSEKVVMKGDAAYLNTFNDGTIDYAYEVSKNFSAKNSGVYLLGLIGGHCHRDIIWKDGNMYQVSPNCASVAVGNAANGDVRRTETDSLSYDSLTVASFASGRIGLVKLGVNVTERGTFRDYEVIDTTT